MVFFFAASAFHGQGRDPPLFAQGIQGTVQGSGSQPYPSAGELLGFLHDAVAMLRMIEGKQDVVGGFRQCRIFHYITSLCIAMRYIMDALYRFSI